MSAAAYVPVSCSECTGLHLQRVEAARVVSCRGCGGTAVVLPSASYEAGDVPAFDRIDAAVRADLRAIGVGYRIASDLRHATASQQTPIEVLLRLVDDLPSLSFLLPPLAVRPPTATQTVALTRATSMLATIVAARVRQLELSSLRLVTATDPHLALD